MNPDKKMISDNSGFFLDSLVVPPMRDFTGALVTTKQGFTSDTTFFKFKSSSEPYFFKINLKPIKKENAKKTN
jgi:hypothetical protein